LSALNYNWIKPRLQTTVLSSNFFTFAF